MATDAALSSLLTTLDDILAHGRPADLPTAQLSSLRDKLDELRNCLQNLPTNTTTDHDDMPILEAKIRDEVVRAESLIADRMYNKFSMFDLVVDLGRFLGICFVLVCFRNLLISNVTIMFCILWIICHPYLPRSIQDRAKVLIISIRSFVLCIDSVCSLLLRFVQIWSRSEAGDQASMVVEDIGFLTAELVRMVGRERDFKEVRERLIRNGSRKLEFVPIVGMCGIGKTTLARRVYEDSCIRSHFDVCAWATVSQSYRVSQVLLDLLESTKLHTHQENGDEGNLGHNLYQSLYGRRYLIVMDDVWDVNVLNAVRTYLPEEKNGSGVLLTTELSVVAGYAGCTSPAHQIPFLNKYESKRLLENGVFRGERCPDELRDIQDEIVGKCEGLPLALVSFSGLLSKIARTKQDWRSLVDSLETCAMNNFDDKCMRILALSYERLPQHLRPCFLYMGMFPEDYMVPVVKLAQLWAAEGFLRPNGSRNPEELAEEYLKDLVDRNLISGGSQRSRGHIKKCKMHNILRRFCLREARRKNFLFVIDHENNVHNTDINSSLRLSIQRIHPNVLNAIELGDSKAHSLLCIKTNLDYLEENPQCSYLHYKQVRVLDLLMIHFMGFPLDVSNMLSLKYLALMFKGPLHPYISRLQNLETLVMNNTDFDRDDLLLLEIWKMPKLRHLHVREIGLYIPPGSTDACAALQTLVEVVNMSFGSHIVEKMKCLKKLGICYDVEGRSFRGWARHELTNLAHLTHLNKLKLRVVNFSSLSMVVPYLPPDLAFPRSLRKLTLSGCRIPWEGLTTVGEIRNLEVLKLRHNACQGEEWEPSEGQFRGLKSLVLQHIDELVHWHAEAANFPRLQFLIIKSCDQLEAVPSGIGDIETLKRIELFDCNQHVVNSAEMIREESGKYGSDLEVNVYSSV